MYTFEYYELKKVNKAGIDFSQRLPRGLYDQNTLDYRSNNNYVISDTRFYVTVMAYSVGIL